MPIIDYSQPISAILRESTRQAHEDVEHSAGAEAMLNGQLPVDEYVRFLIMLWHVYDTFERALESHSTHPVLEPTYNPHLLSRASALSADIAYLIQVPEAEWKKHEIYTDLAVNPPPALTEYVSRIREISNSDDPSPLLAHSYVRYLGDLSGGQTIKHTLAKAYALDETSGEGLTFFAFRNLESSKAASLGDMKRIKQWFREGMNKGVGDNVEIKDAIVEEANLVFKLNKGIFDTIEYNGKAERREIVLDEGGYSVASVAAVVLAVGLAHFMLVVGGFTGNRGYGKLIGTFEWLDRFLKAT